MTQTDTQPRFDLLNQIANFHDDLPSDRMHMAAWSAHDATEYSCGSAGCFGGWTATKFRSMGWSLRQLGFPASLGLWPCFAGSRGSDAVGCFYQINSQLAYWLTQDYCALHHGKLLPSYAEEYGVPFNKITPRHVAHRVRKLIVLLGGEVDLRDNPLPAEKSRAELVGAA